MSALGQKGASCGVTLEPLLYCHPWGRQELVKGLFSLLQSMFAVGWLELKEVQRAQSQLNKCFSNITEPFKVSCVSCHGYFPCDKHLLFLSCLFLRRSRHTEISLGLEPVLTACGVTTLLLY